MTEHKGLVEALIAAQAELGPVPKNQENPHFKSKYADLAAIHTVVLPLLARNGLCWITRPTVRADGQFVLAYKLAHVSGDAEEGEYPLGTGTPQQLGSAITYARRYTLSSVVGIAPEGEDDDGQRAAETRPQQRIEPTKDMIRRAVDRIYAARNKDALRAVWASIAASGMQDAETIDHEGNPASLRDLVMQRGPELPDKEAENAST